jgi:predicted membrane protein
MRNQGQLAFAVILILLGIMFLLGNVLDVNVWKLAWPLGIILFGLWLLLRPRFTATDTSSQVLLGDFRRKGEWQVAEQDIFLGIGDVVLDLTSAEIPLGETRIRVWGFVADMKLTLPQDVGVSVSSNAFFSEVKGLGKKREAFLTTLRVNSDNYPDAERKIRLEASYFVADIKIKQV